jgi:hypothetical protein
MCVTTIVVDSPAARDAGRENWGFPKELGTLSWSGEGQERALRWEERGVLIRGVTSGPRIPALLPYSSLQRRAGDPVWVTGRLRGSFRLGHVELSLPPGDELSSLTGRHRGVSFPIVRVRMGEARPLRLRSKSLRAV